MVDVGVEVIAIGKAEVRRRRDEAVDQRFSVRIEDPGRFQLRQRIGQPLEAPMQCRFPRADDVVRQAAHDLVELGEAAVDGLEHLERVLMSDIDRPLDLPVGDISGGRVGDRGGNGEERNRQRQGCRHHPLQQPQRVALRPLHSRSGP